MKFTKPVVRYLPLFLGVVGLSIGTYYRLSAETRRLVHQSQDARAQIDQRGVVHNRQDLQEAATDDVRDVAFGSVAKSHDERLRSSSSSHTPSATWDMGWVIESAVNEALASPRGLGYTRFHPPTGEDVAVSVRATGEDVTVSVTISP